MKSKRHGEHTRPRVSFAAPSPETSPRRRSPRPDSPARRGRKPPVRPRSPKVFYSSRMRFPSKPSVSKREAKIMAEEGFPLRPGIERDTMLMPWLIADSVLAEISQFFNADLPDEWAAYLDQRAEHCYARNQQFRQLVRLNGNAGRATLYRYFRHWLAGKLHKTNRGLYRQLPRNYSLGAPLPKTLAKTKNL